MVILIAEPMKDTAIKRYAATVKGDQPGQSCTTVVGSNPLSCTIRRLQPSTRYTVDVKACIHGGGGCGAALEKSFTTE